MKANHRFSRLLISILSLDFLILGFCMSASAQQNQADIRPENLKVGKNDSLIVVAGGSACAENLFWPSTYDRSLRIYKAYKRGSSAIEDSSIRYLTAHTFHDLNGDGLNDDIVFRPSESYSPGKNYLGWPDFVAGLRGAAQDYRRRARDGERQKLWVYLLGSSRPGEPPPKPLRQLYVNLSIHTAPVVQALYIP